MEVFQQYEWEFDGIRHLAIHGHQFDRFVLGSMPLSRFLTGVYLQLQKWDFANKRLTRCFDHLDTTWLRLSAKVANGALDHAEANQVGRIFCGHTHEAMQATRNDIQYFNTGS